MVSTLLLAFQSQSWIVKMMALDVEVVEALGVADEKELLRRHDCVVCRRAASMVVNIFGDV